MCSKVCIRRYWGRPARGIQVSDIHHRHLDSLVIVAGHAVYSGDDSSSPSADTSWFLQDFQKGEPPLFIEHIRRGVDLAAADARSLLVFSGGQSRAEAGPKSEGGSYREVAEHFSWWRRTGVEARATTEEFARDSFENLLFGICRFFQCVHRFPGSVKMVTWAFKETRFRMHCRAIRYPESRFEVIGVNNPVDLEAAEQGERRAIALFSRDPCGKGEILGGKREQRNPFHRQHPYAAVSAALTDSRRYDRCTPCWDPPLPPSTRGGPSGSAPPSP